MSKSFDQRFGELRSLLQHAPDQARWRALCALLGALERDHAGRAQQEALPYAEGVTRSWPAALRVAPLGWVRAAIAGRAPAALALCGALRIDAAPSLDEARALARCPQLKGVRALEWSADEPAAPVRKALGPILRRLDALTLGMQLPDRRRRSSWLKECGELDHLSLRVQSAAADMAHLRDAASLARLRSLHLQSADGGWSDEPYWRMLGDAPLLKGLEELELRGLMVQGGSIGALLEGARAQDALGALRVLRLDTINLAGHGLAALATLLRHPQALEEIELPMQRMAPEELARLLPPDGPWEALRQLTLPPIFDHHGAFTDWLGDMPFGGMERLRIAQLENVSFQSLLDWMHAPWMPALRALELERSATPHRAWRDPAVGRALGGLERLSLAHTPLEEEGARGLARHALPALRRVDLSGAIPASALPALMGAPWWSTLSAVTISSLTGAGSEDALRALELSPRLESLTLPWARLDAGGVRHLLAHNRLDHLRALRLDGAPLDDADAARLIEALDRLPALDTLSLRGTRVGDAIAQALLDSGHAHRIATLDVQETQISEELRDALCWW
jgi:hypothetical protein